MSEIREDCYYSKEHEWIKLLEDDIAIVGITDYAQSSLGDVVFVELPPLSKKVSQLESVAVVESVKSASDVYSPVSGQIVEVNANLESSPELVNKSPYEEGWFFKIKLLDKKELENLMDAKQYAQYLASL